MAKSIFSFFKQRSKKMNPPTSSNVPDVDLVIVIDTSPSMKDEAQALSKAAQAAINTAKSSCPSNLRVTWLGIEGTCKGTKFNQTVRAYLTKESKEVDESSFRGRKRGELKSAGARAIEDIINFFNWRKSATKAIFYLGDEALDGGGSKTERADIESANIAVEKAQSAGVKIYSYFGTSKSKHRQGIASEYARLATDTGGQAFTERDAIAGFSAILEKIICDSRVLRTSTDTIETKPATVYIQDYVAGKASKLYTLDLKTGQADLVGSIATEVYDLAGVCSQLYGLQQGNKTTNLVKIDRPTGKATTVGDIGFNVVGLAYNSQGDTLYASAAKQLIAIDLKTGKGKPAVTVSKDKRGCGEIAFDGSGKAYICLIGTDKKKQLATCDLDSGEVRVIGDIGFPDLASMEFVDDVFYGVTGNFFNLGKDGQLLRIDIKTGKGTVVTTTNPIGRWAGMTVYQPATVTATASTSNNLNQTTEEENMQLLTIDTKNNCYVIDPDGMNTLQENVASKMTLDRGNFEIQISDGRYSYSKKESEGEPFVLLWIYGNDGSTFVNKQTGVETGATWTTLNGYNQKLQLEVKQQAVLCALFFNLNNRDCSGGVKLAIKGNSQTQELIVNSQNNTYNLNEQYLSSLKQWSQNFIELESGNYRVKIREGNASYWSDEKKFKLEPWALIWIKAGKFVTQLTGVETSETWCSLNGFKDEFILEVKTKTTLSGLFFDTYKEDNEGQIVVAVEPVSAEEIAKKYQQVSVSAGTNQSSQRVSVSASEGGQNTERVTVASGGGSRNIARTSVTTSSSSNTQDTKTSVTASDSGKTSQQVKVGSGTSFSFRFDEAEMEQMWQQMAAKIETSVTVTDEQDEKKEAQYWDSLEKWILKGYQTQAKDLAIQVARLEFMMKSITQQMEVSFNQNFQGWSSYFDSRLNELIDTRMTSMVEEQVNLKLSDRTTAIKNQVIQQLQSDIDKRVESVVNLKISDLRSIAVGIALLKLKIK